MAGKGQSLDLNSDLKVYSRAELSLPPCPTGQVLGPDARALWGEKGGHARGACLGSPHTGVVTTAPLDLGREACEHKHHIALWKTCRPPWQKRRERHLSGSAAPAGRRGAESSGGAGGSTPGCPPASPLESRWGLTAVAAAGRRGVGSSVRTYPRLMNINVQTHILAFHTVV